ncbi:MAG: hypothetical protein IT382_07265, partial [Deltaproteobacteria bacterium]|nr:hypothetical protein [Deltaproteobacteria bacterium]
MRLSSKAPTSLLCAVLLGATLVGSTPADAGVYMEHEAVLPNPADLSKSIKQTLHSWQDGRRFKRESPLRGE